jgi:hypothetical protein
MSITKLNPNTVHLGGPAHLVNDLAAGVATTPGMTVEMYSNGGVLEVRPTASATEQVTIAVALEQGELNKTVADVYAIGDLIKVAFLAPGSTFWALIPSGQNIAVGALLQSNGDGKLKVATATTADANVAKFQSLEASGAVTADTRIRVQVIQ